MSDISHRTVEANGINMHIARGGQPRRPTIWSSLMARPAERRVIP
jgi:hypothetical protein